MSNIKLSIIIPSLNEAENITTTLVTLQSLRKRHCEIIISDGGSTDNTIQLCKNGVDHYIKTKPGRSSQMNAGAQIARGEVLCFLHADTIATDNIDTVILNSLNTTENVWGFFNIKLSGSNGMYRIIEWLINKRSCLTRIATGDQGIFIYRNQFNKMAGFADIPLMEDIEISKRLGKISKPVCIKSTRLITSSRRWGTQGIYKTIWLMWILRLKYSLGTSPDTLARAYKIHDQ